MSDSQIPATESISASASTSTSDSTESFGEMLSQFDRSHSHRAADGSKQLAGIVLSVSADSIFVDIGYKTEGILPLAALPIGESVKPGDKLQVTVKGRDPEGYYELSRLHVTRPKDWSSLEQAFADKATVVGTVTGVVKGGLTVDVGVRAFLPASRSGTRDAAGMAALVDQEIRCRITKLDVADEDVVVDRRSVLEEEERGNQERRYTQLREGDTVEGTVRRLADFGAFVDLGGVDGLLHISDMAWSRVNNPADILALGQSVTVKVLKLEPGKGRISLGLKQLLPHPWEAVAGKYVAGQRVQGRVTRLMDFGAFVELDAGIEGLLHVSEMSWVKKIRKPSDIVQIGDTVDVVILSVNPIEQRISLGLKQALGDPWADVESRIAVGSVVEGPVTTLTKFGAFVQIAEGVEGMVHISEITDAKRLTHPQEALKVGQVVHAQVLAVDAPKRLIRLSMKQLIPTGLDEYLAEHQEGDAVTGRIVEVTGGNARVELGDGVLAICLLAAEKNIASGAEASPKAGGGADTATDISSLSSMLQARWKGSTTGAASPPEAIQSGQVRKFKITKLDAISKTIELVLA